MSQHVVSPLLSDSRLALPDFESSKIAAGVPVPIAGRAGLDRIVGAKPQWQRNQAVAARQSARAAAPAPAPAPAAPLPTAAAPLPAAGGGATPPPVHAEPAAGGAPAAPSPLNKTLSSLTGMHAAGIGAAAGGLKGLLMPGTEYDEDGRAHTKNRFTSAIGGAATGAAAGALAAPLIRGGARMQATGAFNSKAPGAKEAVPPTVGGASSASNPMSRGKDIVAPAAAGSSIPPQIEGVSPFHERTASLLPSIGLFTKKASLPGGLSADTNQCANGGAANANVVNHKEAAADKIVHTGDPAGMKKGPEDAKAEAAEHKARVADAKKEAGDCSPSFNPAINAKPSAKDKKDAKPGFPQLNLSKKK